MKIIKFIVKENIKEGYSLGEQIIDGLGMLGFFALAFLMLVVR